MKPSSPDNGPVLREHSYDGIQEYDQKLPNWWLFTWYITIVWFIIAWVAYYQLHIGQSGPEQVDKALANIKALQLKELEKLTDDKLWEMSQDPKVVSAGAATFATTCVACHGPDLSAKINGVKQRHRVEAWRQSTATAGHRAQRRAGCDQRHARLGATAWTQSRRRSRLLRAQQTQEG